MCFPTLRTSAGSSWFRTEVKAFCLSWGYPVQLGSVHHHYRALISLCTLEAGIRLSIKLPCWLRLALVHICACAVRCLFPAWHLPPLFSLRPHLCLGTCLPDIHLTLLTSLSGVRTNIRMIRIPGGRQAGYFDCLQQREWGKHSLWPRVPSLHISRKENTDVDLIWRLIITCLQVL